MSDNNQPTTTIRVQQGANVEVSGTGNIRVTVIDYNGVGNVAQREVPAGSTVQNVVGDCTACVTTVNGQAASPNQPVQSGDKITVSPSNVQGG